MEPWGGGTSLALGGTREGTQGATCCICLFPSFHGGEDRTFQCQLKLLSLIPYLPPPWVIEAPLLPHPTFAQF